ncbi:MAG TPA: DUF3667 domain-containing protein [Allosphingosinicella sp.]|nr:DUF3667 domain-containing protein [Allosphingosinicella sp.]
MTRGGVEGVGEAGTGGPAPGAGVLDEGRFCLNCGTVLVGPHCHRCGQAAHVHRTLAAWWHDLAHGVLHLDGKIWRTLPLLAWKPGELTRRYVAGERARFVSPLALFLFSVFLMFAIFSALGPSLGEGLDEAARSDLAAELAAQDRTIAGLERRRRERAAAKAETAALDARIAAARREREGIAALAAGRGKPGPGLRSGWARLDRGLDKAAKNPHLLLYKLQANAYKFSWALIPISVPFLWLLFLHRRRYRRYTAYDHLVFVTYSIAFMSLTLIASVLLSALGAWGEALASFLILVPPVHIYRQLRGAYLLSRWSALWRTVALLFLANVALALFALLLLALGVLG